MNLLPNDLAERLLVIAKAFDRSDEYDDTMDKVKKLPLNRVQAHMEAWSFFNHNYNLRALTSTEHTQKSRLSKKLNRQLSNAEFLELRPMIKGDLAGLMISKYDWRFKKYTKPEAAKTKHDVQAFLALEYPCVIKSTGRQGHVTGVNRRGFYRVSIIPTEDWQKRYRRWMRDDDIQLTGKLKTLPKWEDK